MVQTAQPEEQLILKGVLVSIAEHASCISKQERIICPQRLIGLGCTLFELFFKALGALTWYYLDLEFIWI